MAKDRMGQFNVRMDADLLERYKQYCETNGLDPHQQIIIFVKKMVDSQFDFQEKLWEHIKKPR